MQRSTQQVRRRWGRITAIVAALAVAMTATPAWAGEEEPQHPAVVFEQTVSDAGFTHPGIGVSAENLLSAREQVEAGADPGRRTSTR